MQPKKIALLLLIQSAMISSAFASEQSESKGFVEDADGSILFRTGYIHRDKKEGRDDTSSAVESAIVNLESGYTKGIVGFGVGAVGDFSVGLTENNNSGNNMVPRNDQGEPYDHWARGGASVKARISNTEVRYGTQVLDLPVLASNTARMVPEYFTGTLVNSREIKNLELVAGKFTKNQFSDQISTDENKLDSAIVWGAKYKLNDQTKFAYYGVDNEDRLERHYLNANYSHPVANGTWTFDFSGYHTNWDKDANSSLYSSLGSADDDYQNSIWAVSAAYNTGPHNVMVAYQQNSGNTGYDYNLGRGVADGGQTVYLPNSYLSDFIGNDEKSVQLQYNYDFSNIGLKGLNWTTAFVYGWDIKATDNAGNLTNDGSEEREFFNQVKYTVQSGFAKNASLRVRHSYYRADDYYAAAYIGDTNEWRLFLDIPVNLF
ncbi:outer membrane porin, OprD family [Acinetobacter marinus]|uniref:Outer membrane porin, OprD family n=1 Tax=Acinetobacter marinus TaxID=281375 RepID=A0A1G6JFQ1_9GAMM|nr:OprD family outer membrane porin [Acinetobacter marinus]SDC17507.1 outer membrane porin, OprD family [Acinetobacter marinus]